jgi:hypothetical protein
MSDCIVDEAITQKEKIWPNPSELLASGASDAVIGQRSLQDYPRFASYNTIISRLQTSFNVQLTFRRS